MKWDFKRNVQSNMALIFEKKKWKAFGIELLQEDKKEMQPFKRHILLYALDFPEDY